MVTIERVEWDDPRAIAQRSAMDEETWAIYAPVLSTLTEGELAEIDSALAVDGADMVATILALDGEEVIGHSALRPFADSLEIKKVYVVPSARGRGVSRVLMLALEEIALDTGIRSLVLQTGDLQLAAIALYESLGYRKIPPFRGYEVMAQSLCFEKTLG